MNVDPRARSRTAEELRREFDGAFARPPEGAGVVEDLLQVRLGGTAYALRLDEISGLVADVKITPLPAGMPELLGICSIRGTLLAAYDLGALLGYASLEDSRWIAITTAGPIGLAVATFEGQVSVGRDAIVPHTGDGAAMRHVHEAVRIADEMRPVLSVSSIVEAVRTRVRAASRKEPRN